MRSRTLAGCQGREAAERVSLKPASLVAPQKINYCLASQESILQLGAAEVPFLAREAQLLFAWILAG